MPLFDVVCKNRHLEEILLKHDESVPDCACGSTRTKRVPLIARTPCRWGDTNAQFNRAFGRSFDNTPQLERYAKQHGFVQLSDDDVDKQLSKQKTEAENLDKYNKVFDNVLEETRDPGLAMTQAYETYEENPF